MLTLMLSLVIDAAILGIIIAVMEKDAFPGWGPMIGCVLMVGFTTSVVASLLPGILSLLGLVAGAAVGGVLITWICLVPWRRAATASGIYLGVRILISLGLSAIT